MLGVVVGKGIPRHGYAYYLEVSVSIVSSLAPFDDIADIPVVVAFKDEGSALVDYRSSQNGMRKLERNAKKGSLKLGFIGGCRKKVGIEFDRSEFPDCRPITPGWMVIDSKFWRGGGITAKMKRHSVEV